jgi:hypothetical protein
MMTVGHFDTHILAILDIITCISQFVSRGIPAVYKKKLALLWIALSAGLSWPTVFTTRKSGDAIFDQ